MEKPAVRIFPQMEQYREFVRFPYVWKNNFPVGESNGSFHWQFWETNRVSHQGAWYVSVMRQMVQ